MLPLSPINFSNKWSMASYNNCFWRTRAGAIDGVAIEPSCGNKQNWIRPHGSDQSGSGYARRRNLSIPFETRGLPCPRSGNSQVRVVDRWLSRISCDEKSATSDRRCPSYRGHRFDELISKSFRWNRAGIVCRPEEFQTGVAIQVNNWTSFEGQCYGGLLNPRFPLNEIWK